MNVSVTECNGESVLLDQTRKIEPLRPNQTGYSVNKKNATGWAGCKYLVDPV
jgi:hypothetical protein